MRGSALLSAAAGTPRRCAGCARAWTPSTTSPPCEAAAATWDQFDLAAGTWTKPSSHTKQRKQHKLPLSAPALELLSEWKREATGKLVFPSAKPARKHKGLEERSIVDIKTAWARICRDAGLSVRVEQRDRAGNVVLHKKGKKKEQPVMIWKSTVRIHDLRHSFASVLAGFGASLQLIGSLLGHAQLATTQRYSQLADDARRAAAQRVGAVIAGNGGQPSAEVVEMPKRRGVRRQ